jgi:hypothetical protein
MPAAGELPAARAHLRAGDELNPDRTLELRWAS